MCKGAQGTEVKSFAVFFISNNTELMQSFGLTNYYSWYKLRDTKDAHWNKITKTCQYFTGSESSNTGLDDLKNLFQAKWLYYSIIQRENI